MTCLVAALAGSTGALSGSGQAQQAPSVAPESKAPATSPRNGAPQTYRLPLALGYLTPLSFHVLARLRPHPESALYTGLGFVGMLATPLIVHVAYDNPVGGGIAALGTLSGLVSLGHAGRPALSGLSLSVFASFD